MTPAVVSMDLHDVCLRQHGMTSIPRMHRFLPDRSHHSRSPPSSLVSCDEPASQPASQPASSFSQSEAVSKLARHSRSRSTGCRMVGKGWSVPTALFDSPVRSTSFSIEFLRREQQ